MDGTVTSGWADFAVAMAGAAAALAGLVMVAISVNIKEILAFRGLTARAAAAIASLVLVVVIAALILVPGQPAPVLGAAVLVAVGPVVGLHTVSLRLRTRDSASPGHSLALYVPLAALQLLPVVVGAVVLILGDGAGLYLLAAGVVLTVIGSMLDAWVLMVEILR
jgi:modulator of FtsH protease